MKRKSPTRHKVKSHTREGKPVRSFVRGSGTSKKKLSKVVRGRTNTTRKIEICPACGGMQTVFRPPEDFYEKMRTREYTHAQFYFPCEECKGTGITNSQILLGKTHVEFTLSARGLMGPFRKRIKIVEKIINDHSVGYDVWEERDDKMKKLTRGRKYMPAPSLAVAVKQLLEGGDLTSKGTANVISVS